ncbi:MAG: YqaA family protein [Deltaproteobacteria bacterium]
MNEQLLQGQLLDLVSRWGDLGVFAAMFLESSIVPIPSELIIVGAGAIGVPLPSIIIFGGIGSTLGGICGYFLGRYAGYPFILKFGKYFFIKPHHLEKAESFARKYGAWGVLGGRLTPVIPFKVFSIASGIVRTPLVVFVIFTLIGVLPRIFLLALFGSFFVKYYKLAFLGLALAAAVLGTLFYLKKRRVSAKTTSS